MYLNLDHEHIENWERITTSPHWDLNGSDAWGLHVQGGISLTNWKFKFKVSLRWLDHQQSYEGEYVMNGGKRLFLHWGVDYTNNQGLVFPTASYRILSLKMHICFPAPRINFVAESNLELWQKGHQLHHCVTTYCIISRVPVIDLFCLDKNGVCVNSLCIDMPLSAHAVPEQKIYDKSLHMEKLSIYFM